jgi:hypothetical protein
MAVDKNAPDKDDLNIIRNKEIKSVAKRRQKLGIYDEGVCNGL